MSDLISRSALYNKIKELENLALERVLDTPTNNPCYQRYVAQMNERTLFKQMVIDEPTAYDMKKVIERLKHADLCGVVYVDKAIAIVRAGGKE